MPFDGITIAALTAELNSSLVGGRIAKVAQPESDELILTIKTLPHGGQASTTKRLFISADASLPLLYLSEKNKTSPLTAPGFCMLLRKHLQGGRIIGISQPGLERIIRIHVSHGNEMGDIEEKMLVVEIMGKHSNVIFVNDQDMIIDSIKHVPAMMSSVREVLPGRPYFIPQTIAKADPLTTIFADFEAVVTAKAQPLYQALYGGYSGISPVVAQEICHRAGFDGDLSVAALEEMGRGEAVPSGGQAPFLRLFDAFDAVIDGVKEAAFSPAIYSQDGRPRDFAVLDLRIYADMEARPCPSISSMLEEYYQSRNIEGRIRQKSADLRKIVQTALDRDRRKYDLQLAQIQDAEKKDRWRVYGELLNIYGYDCPPGATSLDAPDHHSGEMLTIPLDPRLSAAENAQRYFEKYGKMKRTAKALAEQTGEVAAEIAHLESIASALDIAAHEDDLAEIKEEMTASGYIRRKGRQAKEKVKSRPFHYLSSDGFHIYVGKNNYQNEDITFRLADGGDWWFHAKNLPGSHVVVKSGGRELPDRVYEEAAALAAYYSAGRGQEKVEVDYVERKHVKKPNGSKPGFVIYHTNYSMVAAPGNDLAEVV